jgi:hypothetical protein
MRNHISLLGDRRKAHTILVGKPEGRKRLGEHWHRLENNVQMDRKETRFEYLPWINLAQNRGEWCSKLCDYRFVVLD